MKQEKLLLGNEAIAMGLLRSGCTMVTSYPGTPASEILAAVSRYQKDLSLHVHVEWSINEKVAFETALANSYAGKRSAVAMKQVGLNVAMDPLMSAAYTGVKGGFVVIVADDPGPHSSQTEQDTRMFAAAAKIPVVDPISPRDAVKMVAVALDLSEKFEIPVILRSTTRISHARQNVPVEEFTEPLPSEARFEKDPTRWAATPKFRYLLHKKLNEKIEQIERLEELKPYLLEGERNGSGRFCIVGSGVVLTHALEILGDLNKKEVPIFRIPVPYPLNGRWTDWLLARYEKILVLEESYPVIEYQFSDRFKVFGRLSGSVPKEGELLPEIVEDIIRHFLGLRAVERKDMKNVPSRRPTLCPGCPHRASFFAIRKVFRKGIYPSDIGCYTLGLNLGAVDTVLCMGAAISQAAGFFHAYRNNPDENRPDIVATIGDSTFFHAGIPALINAVVEGARFVLVVMDNSTTAMTGNQPTPARGMGASGEDRPVRISIEKLVEACGVRFLRVGDPYELDNFIKLLKEAKSFVRDPGGGIAVVIARHPCLMDKTRGARVEKKTIRITEKCKSCHFCVENFECPALVEVPSKDRVTIDYSICTGCGVCVSVCPRKAIEEAD